MHWTCHHAAAHPLHFKPDAKKGTLLFFAGAVAHDEEDYSGGARQAMHLAYKDNKDPDIQVSGPRTTALHIDFITSAIDYQYCAAKYCVVWV